MYLPFLFLDILCELGYSRHLPIEYDVRNYINPKNLEEFRKPP